MAQHSFAHTLHGDGISVSLFHALWSKTRHDSKLAFRIPDTVIFQLGQPSQWYFTGTDGTILRKRKQNLTVERIEGDLTKWAGLESDVIAYFIETTTHESVRSSPIEYLDRRSLHDFLFNKRKERSGVLQRFIEPKGTKQSMLCTIWTPQMCLLERRINKHNLHDERFGLFERAITFDGPEIHSTSAPVRGCVLSRKIQEICEDIADHVGQVSERKNRITRMVVYFKVDASDRVWLLWSSSIRLDGSHEMEWTNDPVTLESVVQIPAGTRLTQAPNHEVRIDAMPKRDKNSVISLCPSCAKAMSNGSSHCMPYKTVVLHFEQVMALARADSEYRGNQILPWPPHSDLIKSAGNVGFGTVLVHKVPSKNGKVQCATEEELCIPPVIRTLHPRLKVPGYQRYRKDLLFLHKSCRVCEDCFLAYAELACNSFHITPPVRIDDDDNVAFSRREGKRISGTDFRQDRNDTRWLPIDSGGDSFKQNVGQVYDGTGKQRNLFTARGGDAGAERFEISRSVDRVLPKAPCMPPAIIDPVEQRSEEHHLSASENEGQTADQANGVRHLEKNFMEAIIKQREREFYKELVADSASSRSKNPLMHLIQSQIALEAAACAELKIRGNGDRLKQRLNPYQQEMKIVEPAVVPAVVKVEKKRLNGGKCNSTMGA